MTETASMRVEPAGNGDLAAIEHLRREAFAHFAPAHYTAQEVANLLEDFDRREALSMIADRALFVARLDGGIVACAGWHGEHIRHVYVRPSVTRRQVGSTILARAERNFRARTGSATVHANVIVYAVGFYRKNGYRVVSEERAWDGSAYVRMIRKLPPG